MAIPAITPLATTTAGRGKSAAMAGSDRDMPGFAATLARQKPPSHSDNVPSARAAAPQPQQPTQAAKSQPTRQSAPDAPDTSDVQAEPSSAPPADVKRMATTSLRSEPLAADPQVARGLANALERTAENPGLALGLATAASAVQENKPTKKEEPALRDEESKDTLLIALPLTQPPVTAVPDTKAPEDASSLSDRFRALQALPDSTAKTANLAGDAPSNAATAPLSGGFAAVLAAHQETPPPPLAPRVDTPLHAPGWSKNFGEGIVWMARSEVQSAQINITPPQLGPIQITLHLNGDQASALFASPHADVRQAIQDALPQLREMLASSGINLGQADVGSQGTPKGNEFAMQHGNQNRYGGETAILSPDTQFADNAPIMPLQRGRGLVDLFA